MAPYSHESVLRNYFRAKDENRPHLLDRVFARDAVLTAESASSAIAFPQRTVGREAITEVLVRAFGRTYENVYSYYLARPGAAQSFACEWIVGMTDKESHNVRFGCGRYLWEFQDTPPLLARSLAIQISAMCVLPASRAQNVFVRLERLSYPWTSRSEVLATLRGDPELEAVISSLGPLAPAPLPA